MRITLKDTDPLSRLPQGRWFAAGAYSAHPSKLARLERLGLVERKPANIKELARTWDWRRLK